ncbi:DUF3969 family protein [Mammaliicoccus sciuri]|uniref:DUF3969 family protein n=2 Tax=Mammaliicoccus sciuri TaxID=1296 RepID=UPI00226EF9FB|nr:DUF3969 family protein [Mammaliicoccus sciuri]MCY1027752.1 DUF3969 family protein [Mammaliicoccus sciuri]
MITFKNTMELEKFTLITMHGLFNQIRLNLITIENAEHILFTPYIMNKLKKNNVSEEILSLVHEGTELEDLKSLNILSDEELSRLINETERLLKNYQDIEFNDKIYNNIVIGKDSTSNN